MGPSSSTSAAVLDRGDACRRSTPHTGRHTTHSGREAGHEACTAGRTGPEGPRRSNPERGGYPDRGGRAQCLAPRLEWSSGL